MKIAIIGSGGAGKTTLALALSQQLSIPVYHLDQYRWTSGWNPVDSAEIEHIHNTMCDKESWIIDGNYTKTMPYRFSKADVIIFLDIPRWKRLYRIFKRRITHHGIQRLDQPHGCQERLTWGFVSYIWHFNHKVKPEIMRLLKEQESNPAKKVYMIKELKQIFAQFTHNNQETLLLQVKNFNEK